MSRDKFIDFDAVVIGAGLTGMYWLYRLLTRLLPLKGRQCFHQQMKATAFVRFWRRHRTSQILENAEISLRQAFRPAGG